MNDLELKQAKHNLYQSDFWKNTPHEKRYSSKAYMSLSAIDMINSHLAYDKTLESKPVSKLTITEKAQIIEGTMVSKYMKEYIEALGEKHIRRYVENQLNDIKYIEVGTMTDSEGLSYNSIVWAK